MDCDPIFLKFFIDFLNIFKDPCAILEQKPLYTISNEIDIPAKYTNNIVMLNTFERKSIKIGRTTFQFSYSKNDEYIFINSYLNDMVIINLKDSRLILYLRGTYKKIERLFTEVPYFLC